MTPGDQTTGWGAYTGAAARRLAAGYDSLDPRAVHGWLLDLIPPPPALVLDVGAGSGRDAAWLAGLGYRVHAAEPSRDMRALARHHHGATAVRWLDAALPDLRAVRRLGAVYEFILVSAVWMHLDEPEREEAFRTLSTLLAVGGILAVTLRLGMPDRARRMFPVSAEEIRRRAKAWGLDIVRASESGDFMRRPGLRWAQIALRRP